MCKSRWGKTRLPKDLSFIASGGQRSRSRNSGRDETFDLPPLMQWGVGETVVWFLVLLVCSRAALQLHHSFHVGVLTCCRLQNWQVRKGGLSRRPGEWIELNTVTCVWTVRDRVKVCKGLSHSHRWRVWQLLVPCGGCGGLTNNCKYHVSQKQLSSSTFRLCWTASAPELN